MAGQRIGCPHCGGEFLLTTPQEATAVAAEHGSPATSCDRGYFILINNNRVGPHSLAELSGMLSDGVITRTTPIVTSTDSNWVPLGELLPPQEVERHRRLPPPPPSSSGRRVPPPPPTGNQNTSASRPPPPPARRRPPPPPSSARSYAGPLHHQLGNPPKFAPASNRPKAFEVLLLVGFVCLLVWGASALLGTATKGKPVQTSSASPAQPANNQDANALFRAGEEHEGNSKTAEAVQCYLAAATLGHREAQQRMGYAYSLGEGISENAQESAKWFAAAASQGDVESQTRLAECFRLGIGVAKNEPEAFRAASLAAGATETGEPPTQQLSDETVRAEAQKFLGECYEDGIGTAKNPKLAVKWYLRAANNGDLSAQYEVGLRYSLGDGVTKSLSEAVKWLVPGAQKGRSTSQLQLGLVLAEIEKSGAGTFNYSVAVGWMTKAADKGNKEAMLELGIFFCDTGKNYSESYKWLKAASDKGHPDAPGLLQKLAVIVSNSDSSATLSNKRRTPSVSPTSSGKAKSTSTGTDLASLKTNAERGIADAQFALAVRLERGQGTAKNLPDAYGWYLRAANAGYTKAMSPVALMNLNGLGTKVDRRAGIQWFKRAAEAGVVEAQFNYANLMQEEEQGYEAFVWYLKAAQAGHLWSMRHVAIRYSNGNVRGVPVNYLESIKWRKLLVDRGSIEDTDILAYTYWRSGDLVSGYQWMYFAAIHGVEGAATQAETFGRRLQPAVRANAEAAAKAYRPPK